MQFIIGFLLYMSVINGGLLACPLPVVGARDVTDAPRSGAGWVVWVSGSKLSSQTKFTRKQLQTGCYFKNKSTKSLFQISKIRIKKTHEIYLFVATIFPTYESF